MPNRMVREALLDSERVCSLPIEAQLLFVKLMLVADDLGCFEVNLFALSRRCSMPKERIATLIELMSAVDLVRLYAAEDRQYGFIPRFRQRIQIKKLKYPEPPACVLVGDNDASSKIKSLQNKHPLPNRCPTDAQPSEAEAEAEANYLGRQVGAVARDST